VSDPEMPVETRFVLVNKVWRAERPDRSERPRN
jgi:hypothetical protein